MNNTEKILYDKINCVYDSLTELVFIDIPYEYKEKVIDWAKKLLDNMKNVNAKYTVDKEKS